MNSGWRSCTLQEFVADGRVELKTGPFGTQLKASDYVDDGTPVINVRNIGFGSIRASELEYISDSTVARLESHLLEAGDIVFGRKGAVERHAFIQSQHQRWFQGSDCLRLRVKTREIVPRFLSYYFLTDFHQRWMMNQCSHGATMASLNQEIISRIPLDLPPPDVQARIVELLSVYDDLIENNERRIDILENMAASTFREWFVHFRFPGHRGMTFAQDLPKGWTSATVGSLAEVNARSIKRGNEPTSLQYIDIASVAVGRIEKAERMAFADAPGRARRIVQHGDIIWSCVRPNRRSYALILDPPPDLIVSTGFAVISATTVPYEYLYHALTTDAFVGYLTNHATGAAYPAVTAKDFEKADVIKPPPPLLVQFAQMVGPFLRSKQNLLARNQVLRRTRDLLLPRLVSGRLRVAEIDASASARATTSLASSVGTAEVQSKATIAPAPSPKSASDQFKEAVLLSALVRAIGTEQYPLGRKRRTKFRYLVHRKAEHDVAKRFAKMAAGPYDPASRYQGPEKIALQNGYVREHQNGQRSGFIAGNRIADIDKYLPKYEVADALDWAVRTFKFKNNDDLELLTTVDLAALDLVSRGKSVDCGSIREVIASEPKWLPKLDRSIFSDINIQAAINELERHFGSFGG